MIKVENGRVNAKDVYEFVEVKSRFNDWLNNCIEAADLKDGKDFYYFFSKSPFGRPSKECSFTIDAAKEVCLVSATAKGKALRRYFIDLGNKAENLELMTVKQAAMAFKVVSALRYVSEQKAAFEMHQNAYIAANDTTDKNVYAEFAKYRAKIVGWDKAKIDEALNKYLQLNYGYSKHLASSNTQTKLSAIDLPEAIRVATLDFLSAKGENSEIAQRFATLCKNLAAELELKPEKNRMPNIFKEKDDNSIKSLN